MGKGGCDENSIGAKDTAKDDGEFQVEPRSTPALSGYQEMVRDMENGTFQPDFVPDLDIVNVPNPFDKYDSLDAHTPLTGA